MTDVNRAWGRFEQELTRMNLRFQDVQGADEKSRGQLLEHLGLGPLERVMVSSQWATMQRNGTAKAPNPPPVSLGFQPSQSPSRFAMQPVVLQQPSDFQAFDVGPDSDDHRQLMHEMRRYLSTGDTTNALTCATSLVEQSPRMLIQFLHEYMPHLSMEQVAQLVGVDPEILTRPMSLTKGMGGDGGYEAGQGTLPARVNGMPVRPGEVLTAGALSAQFGIGFLASCNGSMLVLPYCVQPGDVITVQANQFGVKYA